MDIHVTARPHMLLETVELLFAYINGVPPRMLTGEGEYCIPAQAVGEMMDAVCAGISKSDPAMVYYFGRHTFTDELGRGTCIARNLAYDSMSVSRGSISQDCEFLRSNWHRRHDLNHRIDSIDEFSLSYQEAANDYYVPLAKDIARLPVSPEYAQMLLEQFSNYDEALSRLEGMIAPVAEKLEPLLTPWSRQALELERQWSDRLRQPEAMAQFLKNRVRVKHSLCANTYLQFRYFMPTQGFGKGVMPDSYIYMHMGVALPVEKREAEAFEAWEFEALRLLGGEARMRMLRLMQDKPMSARELTKLLGLHLGTVCRDINSLYSARLLLIECVGERKRYRTNMDTIHLLSKHLAELDKFKAL